MNEGSSFPISTPVAVLIGAVIIAIAIMINGGTIKLQGLSSQVPSTPQQVQVSPAPRIVNVGVGNLPALGNPNAKVTVVEFADFQCPFCLAVTGLQPNSPVASQLSQQDPSWQPFESNIRKDYVDSGKVRYIFRDFAFLDQASDPAGSESTNAANAARCANDQGKFWQYHDYLYSHQGQEDQGTFSKDNLKKFASDLGLNSSQFNQCVDSDKYIAEVKKDTSDGRSSGVDATPTIFVNGQELRGAAPYSDVKQAIDSALASTK